MSFIYIFIIAVVVVAISLQDTLCRYNVQHGRHLLNPLWAPPPTHYMYMFITVKYWTRNSVFSHVFVHLYDVVVVVVFQYMI